MGQGWGGGQGRGQGRDGEAEEGGGDEGGDEGQERAGVKAQGNGQRIQGEVRSLALYYVGYVKLGRYTIRERKLKQT